MQHCTKQLRRQASAADRNTDGIGSGRDKHANQLGSLLERLQQFGLHSGT